MESFKNLRSFTEELSNKSQRSTRLFTDEFTKFGGREE
jgi:hypothetical protein